MEKINNILDALSRTYYGRDVKVKKNTTGAVRYIFLIILCLYISYSVSAGIQLLFFYKNQLFRLVFILPIFFTLLKLFRDLTTKNNFLNKQYIILISAYFYVFALFSALFIFYTFLNIDQKNLNTSEFISFLFKRNVKQDLPILFITFASIIILALSFIGLIITKKSDLKLLEKENQNEKLKEKSRNDWTLYLHKLRENEVESINSQILIFTNINHELGNKLPQIKIDVDTLYEYLKSKEFDSLNLLNEPVQKPLSIEDSTNIEKVEELLKRMDNSLKYSINVINSMGMIIKLGPNNLKKEVLNIFTFFTNEIESFFFDRMLIQIKINCDPNLFGEFDQFQFKVLISNFVENAIRHGKFQSNNNNFILFNIYENDDSLIFEIINNGQPVDAAFTINDFVKPNSFFGETGNTGFGGYIIGMILINHEGKIELIDKTYENIDYKVCFKITIPKK